MFAGFPPFQISSHVMKTIKEDEKSLCPDYVLWVKTMIMWD